MPARNEKRAAGMHGKLDPRASVVEDAASGHGDELEFPREDLRFVCDLGTDGDTQLAVMEAATGFACTWREGREEGEMKRGRGRGGGLAGVGMCWWWVAFVL